MALPVCLTRGAGSATEGQKVTVAWNWQGQIASDPQMYRQQRDSTTELEPLEAQHLQYRRSAIEIFRTRTE